MPTEKKNLEGYLILEKLDFANLLKLDNAPKLQKIVNTPMDKLNLEELPMIIFLKKVEKDLTDPLNTLTIGIQEGQKKISTREEKVTEDTKIAEIEETIITEKGENIEGKEKETETIEIGQETTEIENGSTEKKKESLETGRETDSETKGNATHWNIQEEILKCITFLLLAMDTDLSVTK